MIRILDNIEKFKQVPAQVTCGVALGRDPSSQIGAKVDAHLKGMHYVHATILLSNTLKQLQQYQEVGALADFRMQLADRSAAIAYC